MQRFSIMNVIAAVEEHQDEGLKEKFRTAFACLQRCLDIYGLQSLAFSFNGGKDSTVLLHILRAAVASWLQLHPDSHPCRGGGLGGICTFIFERSDDFSQILDFVRATNTKYDLHVEQLEGDFKSGLSGLLARRPIKAVVLGTRRGDPNAAGQDMFCPSSADWPPFMRVNPILKWSYTDVWAFLRAVNVEYCSLYDEGYTSIGSIDNTTPNSSLRKGDGSFAPAYMLADSRMERAGRVARGTPRASEVNALTRSAALLIIGDEILSGKVEDINSRFLCRELFLLGWRVCKIVTIADDIGAISEEARAASESHDIVITTGGVGPTHDDVTMAGVARALGYPLTHDQNLESRLRGYFGEHITEAHLKMAEAPAGEVELVDFTMENGSLSPFPVLCCRNIYILPGIPSLLQQKWKVLKEHLKKGGALAMFHSVALRLAMTDETQVAPALHEVATELRSFVSIGSYPVSRQADGAGIVLHLESKDLRLLSHAKDQLLQKMPPDCLISEEQDSRELSKGRLRSSGSLAGLSPSQTASASLDGLALTRPPSLELFEHRWSP